MTQSERIGLSFSLGLHAILIAGSFMITFDAAENERSAFIEVTVGEFSMGTPTQRSEQNAEEIETRRNTSDTKSNSRTKTPNQEDQVQKSSDEQVKDVDLSDQDVQIPSDEVVKTAEAEELDPTAQKQKEETDVIPSPNVKRAEEEKEGAKTSGSAEGSEGQTDTEEGTGVDDEKASPFLLEWDGEIKREPKRQPLPSYEADVEAEITIRFQVKPDGTVGQMIPLKKMNPELEREILKTLRTWRFSRLPKTVPQTVQWGTITFRFVLE